jgi:hypothetical protein
MKMRVRALNHNATAPIAYPGALMAKASFKVLESERGIGNILGRVGYDQLDSHEESYLS